MNILGIETAANICGTALANEKRIIAEKNTDAKNQHSSLIFNQIDDLLKSSNIEPNQIDGVAVSIGPGSYTGLRIGLSAAKGIAFGLNIPILGIPTLDSLAQQYRGLNKNIWATLPFRRNELYLCKYSISKFGFIKNTGYLVMKTSEFLKKINHKIVVVGKVKDKVKEILESNKLIEMIPFSELGLKSGIIAEMGIEKMKKQQTDDLFQLEPLYLKSFPVK